MNYDEENNIYIERGEWSILSWAKWKNWNVSCGRHNHGGRGRQREEKEALYLTFVNSIMENSVSDVYLRKVKYTVKLLDMKRGKTIYMISNQELKKNI